MQNIKLEIEYDGTNFYGWSIQPHKRTVRGEIEQKLNQILQEKIKLVVAGRTDTGTHAICQVANFITTSNISTYSIKQALLKLPGDIYIKTATQMPLEFHSRRDAISRIYLYRLLLNRSSLLHTRVWEYTYKLDINRIKNALPLFLGTYRFDLLAHKDTGECKVIRFILTQQADELNFEIEANRFLRRMVRMIIGVLVTLGRGKVDENDIKEALELKGRKPFLCAASCGLYLKEVKYKE